MRYFLIILYIGLGCLCSQVNAQNIRLEGIVKDSIGNPLDLANVLALHPKTKSIASYGITDDTGRFALSLKRDSTYILKVSYLGFKTHEEVLKFEGEANKVKKEIILYEDANALDAVEVVQELPISIKGDTIVYKADAFTNGKERKLENVLEKLPGFEIDDNGDVKVQGKKVENVLVEGKKFFDGNTKLATKNIPADAVDKVEVLRDFNDVAPTRGLNNEESLALNIKLKEGKKNILFGDLEASAGHDERYFAHANLFYYNPKRSVNFIGDANNLGRPSLSLQDLFRLNGGFGNLSARAGSSIDIASEDRLFTPQQNNRAADIISNLGALNLSFNPNKKWNFTGFLIASDTDTDLVSNTFRTFLLNDNENNQELLTSEVNQENRSALGKFTAKYTPNSKWDVSLKSFFKISDLGEENNRLSNFLGVENSIQSNNEQQPFSFNQSFNAFYARNKKNVFSFQAEYLFKEQDPFFDLLTSEDPFGGGVSVFNEGLFNLLQDQEIRTSKFDASFDYYYVFNRKNHINFTAGTTLSSQELISNIRQRNVNTNEENALGAPFINDTSYDFTDVYLSIRYRFKAKDFIVSPSLNLHYFDTNNQQIDQENDFDRFLLLPSLYAKYNFKRSESLTLNYNLAAQFTDINNIVSGTSISNFNTLTSGNPLLENQLFHRFTLRYQNFNSFNFTNIFGTLNYTRTIDAITNTVLFNGINQVLSPINAGSFNDILSANGSYERRFIWFKTRASVNLSLSNTNNTINGEDNTNESFTQNYRLSWETNFKNAPNFEVGFQTTINNFQGNQTDSRFVTNAPYANLEIPFLKHFLFNADYQYTDFVDRTQGNSNSYDFLNATLAFRKGDSPFEFNVSATNITNTTSINRDSFNNFLISNNQFFVQPRYVVFGLKYDL